MNFLLTTIYVSDMDCSLSFYCDLLGLPLIHRFQAGNNQIAMLGEENSTHLELICGNISPKPSSSMFIGIAPSDLPKVKSVCCDTLEGPICPNPDTTFWFVNDPDGYRIQLLETTK